MKGILFFVLLLLSDVAFAQKFNFPKLTTQSENPRLNIPKNWAVIAVVGGDLNTDTKEDLVLVLEHKTPIIEDRAYGNYAIELIQETQKPRILAIYFKTKTNKYRLALQNNDFILRSEEGGKMGDPLKALDVTENKLTLSFEGGNAWRWKLNYGFEYQDKAWVLVNANNVYYNKDSGEMIDKQYNFIERTIKTVVGSIFERSIANNSDEDTLVFGQPRTLNDFKKPWTWEVTKDNYL